MTQPDLLFLGPDTYSQLGGLQQFNRRLIAALAKDDGVGRLRVHLMRDRAEHMPSDVAADIVGFGADRIGFVRQSLRAARGARMLLLGQINLLPVGWLAKRMNPRLKLVLFVHGIEVWNDPQYRRRRFYEPALLGAVDRVASVSRYTAMQMHRHFGTPVERFAIFPNAVDGPIMAPSAQATRMLLAVTRMAAHDRGKNLDSVLRAFAMLEPDLGDVMLEIVGDGELRAGLEALAVELGISARVRFLGRVSDAELAECYRRAGAFILPSSKEGFGIVYLEAWKFGLPVICGTEGASREVVGDGIDGLVVDPADRHALASAMAALLRDPERARAMGERGARKVAEHYLDANFRTNLAELIRGVA